MVDTRKAKYKYENISLIIGIVLTITILYLFFDFNPILTIALIIVGLFYVRLLQGQYLGNSLQANEKHFYRLKQIIAEQSKKIAVKEPKLFINQDPYPNAYTIGYKNPYSIILSSSLVEALSESELEAVIAHELGHVKFNHSRISSIISPANNNIFILTWIFGFWQRSTEFTADKVSVLSTENPRSLITALFKISIGPKFLDQIDEDELIKQSKIIQNSFFNKCGELLLDHPYLTKRINNILLWAKENQMPYYKGGIMFCTKCGLQINTGVKFCPQCGEAVSERNNNNKEI